MKNKLTDKNLWKEKCTLDGYIRRIYKLENNRGLIVRNPYSAFLKSYLWEIIVIESIKKLKEAVYYEYTYDKIFDEMPRSFRSTKKANEYIEKYFEILEKL